MVLASGRQARALGEPADHEQTHVPGGVRGYLAAGLQADVGDPQIGVGHAQPDVADLDDQPSVAGVQRRDPHLRNRRRVAQRVVEQLGEQVHEVAGHPSDDLAVGHRRGDDAGVVLDLGGRGVDQGRHRHRVGLLARHLRACEHQEVGAVSAHPRGQVIEPEQALQPLRILLVAFQPVDERELLVDQRAAAPRQRLEHVADLQLQPALLAGQEARPARAVRRRRVRPGPLPRWCAPGTARRVRVPCPTAPARFRAPGPRAPPEGRCREACAAAGPATAPPG